MAVLRFIEKNLERGVASLLICLISISLILQVFFRYVMSSPLTWPEEAVSFLFPWFVYLGASYGVREGAHIRLTHHITLFSEVWQKVVRVIADLCWLFYSIVMVVHGTRFVQTMFQFPYRGQVFTISKAYLYAIIPIAFGLMSIRIIVHIVRVVNGSEEPYSIRQQKQLLD
jgi:C4-dicarboxylate transporter, DctQ subunit